MTRAREVVPKACGFGPAARCQQGLRKISRLRKAAGLPFQHGFRVSLLTERIARPYGVGAPNFLQLELFREPGCWEGNLSQASGFLKHTGMNAISPDLFIIIP